MSALLAASASLLATGGCSTWQPPVPDAAPATTLPADIPVTGESLPGVGVEPKTIHPLSGEKAIIRYELPEPAEVSVALVDAEGRIVRTLPGGSLPKGAQETVWDGRSDSGAWTPAGAYRYIITASTASGRRVVHDATASTGGEELSVRSFEYDDKTGELRWVMPKAGLARLRIGIEGFPHLRTLFDWQPFEAGAHSVVWDGMDASGLVSLKDHPKRLIKLTAFSMPDNTVIVAGTPADPSSTMPASPAAYPVDVKGPDAYLHARHRRSECGEVRLSVDFVLPGLRRDAQGRPILLAGTVPVRVTLDPADAARVANSRFEVSLYEDLNFLFEEEDGINPFTFEWKTEGLTPGVHLLTVNILTYDDHYGVLTVPVVIERH